MVAIGAWLAGPGSLATRIREGVKGLVSGEGAEGGEPSSVGRFVAHYKMVLRAVVIGIGLLILVILAAPTPLVVLIIVAARRHRAAPRRVPGPARRWRR